jgi:hypothetical protein
MGRSKRSEAKDDVEQEEGHDRHRGQNPGNE